MTHSPLLLRELECESLCGRERKRAELPMEPCVSTQRIMSEPTFSTARHEGADVHRDERAARGRGCPLGAAQLQIS